MPQTPDVIQGVWSTAVGAVVGTLAPQSYGRRIATMAIVGPPGSVFSLYRGYVIDASQLLVTTARGSRNTYDAAGTPITVQAGEAVTAVWSAGSAAPGETGRVTIISDWGR